MPGQQLCCCPEDELLLGRPIFCQVSGGARTYATYATRRMLNKRDNRLLTFKIGA